MALRVKGLLKGLRYISQIFDEEKEEEMHIGLPTDVKHVAHIGWDGPTVDSPSWMKGFEPTEEGNQSVASSVKEPKDKSRHSRRNHSKDSANTKSNRNGNVGSDSSTGNLPNMPKKSRKKKKDSNSSRSAKSKGSDVDKESSL